MTSSRLHAEEFESEAAGRVGYRVVTPPDWTGAERPTGSAPTRA
jgi:hypothetical protein